MKGSACVSHLELIGRTIVNVRFMTSTELDREGWPEWAHVTCMELDNGAILYPATPDEEEPGAQLGFFDGSTWTIHKEKN